ncbi:GNAT family N-acetyltransferase [Helicobacter jaachi]|uniref:GNAT family N-acetyltransferase n=1 Tax=Helicobacter jaachi TaxID=1677920 RepID=A0A4U8T9N8_9HELI|nr:GNAT family N-acetyltransferase [Helicobacter jaachi]TLD96499.1 GNAT family N-acetyltransferase [Helicobacter jaachi]
MLKTPQNTHNILHNENLAAADSIDSMPFCIFTSNAYAASTLESNEHIFHFSYTQQQGAQGQKLFYNIAQVQSIPDTPYFDMSSPYGYGGYYTNSSDQAFLQDALCAQAKQARAKHIIAEFIRFHPYFAHTRAFEPLLDFFAKERDIVVVSTDSKTRFAHYSSRLRGKLRKARQLLSITQSRDVSAFHTLYTQTMERNGAQDFYFFSRQYLSNLLSLKDCIMLEARYQGQIVAMGIFLFDNLCGYYHLGANAPLSLSHNLNAMGALFEAFFELSAERGLQTCILGGGRSGDSADSLFVFKKQFATTLIPFYIGGMVYDSAAYNRLSVADSKYFLSYRFKEDISIISMGGGAEQTFIGIFARFFLCADFTLPTPILTPLTPLMHIAPTTPKGAAYAAA